MPLFRRGAAPLDRHLLRLVLSALLPLFALGAGLAFLLVQQERRSTEHGLQEGAQLLSRAVDAELERSFAALQALTRSESLRRGDLKAFYSEATDVRNALGLWDNLLLLSPSAEHLLNLMRPYGTPLPPVPQPQGTLRAAETRQPYVSDVLKGRVETDWLMYIAFPVIQGGEVKYVIGATMNYRYWTRWLSEHAPAGTTAGILDRNQVVLARTRDAERFAGQQVQPWYRDVLKAKAAGVVRGQGLNEEVVVAFQRSALSGWTINVLTPASVVDAPMRHTAWLVIAATLAALGLGIALALRRAAVLTRGMQALQDALEALKGNRRPPALQSPVAEIQAAMGAAEATANVLASRAERLERAQRAARLGFFDWDLRTDAVQWSDGIYRILGASPGSVEPSSKWWQSRMLPEEREAVLRRFEAIVHSGGAFNEEFRIVRLDGVVRWVASIGTVDLDSDGAPLRMQGVNMDVTERREAEELLRQSEEKFRTISHAAPAMVWVTDAAGAVVFLNQRWFQYTGQSEAQAKGNGWTAATHPEDVARLVARWQRCAATGETYEGECRYRRRDGQHRWHAFRALPSRGPDGAIVQWFGCSVDVHDARQAQEALREADRRKDEFLATLAHELRNPLAPIRNALHLLNRKNTEDPAMRAAQEMMDRQVAHMVRLIDDLLDVSRITRGKLDLRREPVTLAQVIEQALETSRPHLVQQLTVSLPSEPVYLDADPVRLAQVFSNLLNNAARYTAKGGRISVAARRQADQVEVRVRDDGIGISREQLPRLFQMFTQGSAAPERSHGGLGIGLSLARSLVELHGGEIEAHSEGPGRGSEFVVRLPVLPSPEPAQGAATPPPIPYGGAVRRVLVVDDVEDNVKSLAALLRLDGNQVETAGDGLEAVRKAEAFKPDLILLDLGLPNLSGVEACRLIRRQSWGKGIVIVALTGWGQDDDRRRTAQAGFDGHLVKPVSYSSLQELLASPLMG